MVPATSICLIIYCYLIKYMIYHSFFIQTEHILFFYCCAGWGYIVAFTKVLTIYQIYCTWVHPLHHSPSPSPSLIPRIVSTDNIFLSTYMCTQYLYHIHFRHHFPPHQYQPQAGLVLPSCSPILYKKKIEEQNDIFAV
jgi:hypothetical protein